MQQDPMKILVDAEQPEPRRIEAAKAIGRARNPAVIDRLLVVTESSETLLTRAIVDALKEIGAHEVLARRLADPDPAVRADAGRKLSKLQDERAAEALIRAARDPEPPVRRATVHALSYLKGPGVFEALVASLADRDPETRAYAASGVGRIGDVRAMRTLAAAREAEEDEIVRDFIDAAIRKLPKEPSATR